MIVLIVFWHFCRDGEEWLSRRRVINQLLLHPRALPHFSQRINDTINDLIKHWTNRSPVSATAAPPNTGDPTGQSITINNIQEDVFNWSIECTYKTNSVFSHGQCQC